MQTSPPRCTHSTAASVHWHLHPQWSAHLDGSLARLRAGTTDLTLHVLGGELEQFVADEANGLGWFAPVYGRIEATTTLRVSATCRAPHWFVSVFTLDPANATMALALDEVAVRGRVAHHATAVRIDRTRGVDRLVIAEPVDGAHSVRWHAAGVEADAPMLLTREREGQLTAVAVVDATSVSARQHPELERSMLSFVSNAAAGSREDTDRRKAS